MKIEKPASVLDKSPQQLTRVLGGIWEMKTSLIHPHRYNYRLLLLCLPPDFGLNLGTWRGGDMLRRSSPCCTVRLAAHAPTHNMHSLREP
jgi:hypothetical protein